MKKELCFWHFLKKYTHLRKITNASSIEKYIQNSFYLLYVFVILNLLMKENTQNYKTIRHEKIERKTKNQIDVFDLGMCLLGILPSVLHSYCPTNDFE